ncbi:hypothetical protein [Clostridium sp. ZBS4]|uniref:hypothetical protein n=1 Tax=Clostridium sp. ZBS4 TaxID=2949974 RepID=UPI00207A1FC6|nr:hypothetical protein [Clostridium sp. ZBS4]
MGKSKNIRARAKQELNDMKVHTIDEVKNKKMKADFNKYSEKNFQYFVRQECSMELSIYLEDFINEFKVIIYKYATIEMIIEVMIRFNFSVFVYNQIGNFYYQITSQEFKKLYNNEYSYHNKLIENDLVNNIFYKQIQNIGVGIYRYNITDTLVQFVKNYNNNLYQEACKLEGEKRILKNDVNKQGDELKK